MKEIDFLPKWYTAGRKKKVNYRRLYLALGVLFTMLVMWSMLCTYSVSISKGQVDILQSSLERNKPIAAKYADFAEELTRLREQKAVIEKLGQKTRFSYVLAELSTLMNESIVLEELSVEAMKVEKPKAADENEVRLETVSREKKVKDISNSRKLRLIIRGVGEQPSNVAALISKLEASDYFCNVMPGYSKNSVINEHHVTEFEIVCYVADYVEGAVQ